MTEKENKTNEGYVPEERGYKPSGTVTGGHKPEKAVEPTNPPKKK